jgi:hypothetical protein
MASLSTLNNKLTIQQLRYQVAPALWMGLISSMDAIYNGSQTGTKL